MNQATVRSRNISDVVVQYHHYKIQAEIVLSEAPTQIRFVVSDPHNLVFTAPQSCKESFKTKIVRLDFYELVSLVWSLDKAASLTTRFPELCYTGCQRHSLRGGSLSI